MNGSPAWAIQLLVCAQQNALLWRQPKQPAVPAEASSHPIVETGLLQQVMRSSDMARACRKQEENTGHVHGHGFFLQLSIG